MRRSRRRRSPGRGRASALALALLAAAPGCADESGVTEIVLTVDTTLGVPCAVDHLRFEAAGDGEPVTREVSIDREDLPGSFTLLPAGEPGPVSVRVTALHGSVTVATAAHDTDFVAGVSREVRFLLDDSCVDANEPCDAVAGGPFGGELPPPAVRRGCGEEYWVRPTLAAIQDACEVASEVRGVILQDTDREEVRSPLTPGMPFPFRFYGRPVSQLWVSDNGYLGLGDDPPMALLPSIQSLGVVGGFPPVPGILPFWERLKTSSDGVCLAVDGVPPYRILWITWHDACFLDDPSIDCGPLEYGRLRFSVGLEETSNAVYVGYLAMETDGLSNDGRAQGLTAVIGIRGGEPACKAAECDDGGRCASGVPCGYTEFSANHVVDPLPDLEFVPR